MVGLHSTSKPSPYTPETLCFEHTEPKTVSMVKRYFQYFQRKLSLLGLQVVDLCELVYKDETVRQKFESDNGNTSLHHSLDRFLMGVLKGFLQNIDEGFADIIDELEDCCSEDHYVQSILKRVIYEFQQNSFSKRQELAKEYDEENEEIGKPSYEWFDSFFGDVTTLLKNPISRSAYQRLQGLCRAVPGVCRRIERPGGFFAYSPNLSLSQIARGQIDYKAVLAGC